MRANERPTAVIQRVDLSPTRDGASAARSTSEEALFHGYTGAVSHLETQPCACGGSVTADPFRPAPGVAAHQFTSRHVAWRAAHGLDD